MWFSQRVFVLFSTTAFLTAGISAEIDNTCRQAVFERVSEGAPSTENIISSHHVGSWFECGIQCLQQQERCVAFSYLPDKNNVEINCQLSDSQAKDEEVINEYTDDMWTTYEIRDVIPEICAAKSLCQNGGQCIANSCEPEGYSCKCNKKHYGRHCENENNDFDLSFRSQEPVRSYVQMDAIKTDLHQLTFSVWFKISTGLQEYHLLSYMANGVAGYIDLYFSTSSNSGSVNTFRGKIVQQGEGTWMTPVNDGFWHHLGFTWTSTGHWNVLIDGTHRALRGGVKIGGIIPGGGTLVIGQKLTTSGFQTGFIGEISRLNLWDRALSGNEIEAMAKSPGNERGNIIMWFNITDYVVGDVEVIAPSKAQNTDQGLDFELSFESPPSGKDYVLSPGPKDPFDQMSVCLWIKTLSKSIFISYNTEEEVGHTFAFGVDSDKKMFAYINGNLILSTSPNAYIINNQWHYLCSTWNGQSGNVWFYYDGVAQGVRVTKDTLKTVLPGRGSFLVGATKDSNGSYVSSDGFVGKISYVNVWSTILSRENIAPLTSGGVNINGDFLAWRDVPKAIVGNLTINTKTVIRFPGYGLLAKRSKWCNDHVSTSCGTLYARFGEHYPGKQMAWRCYCASSLHDSKYTYNFAEKKTTYYSKHAELIAIVD